VPGLYESGGKRTLDIAGAAVALILAVPLLAVLALAVLVVLGRPVLFRQARIGRNGVPFAVLKFRSMAAGPGEDAARLGRFGRALRASGLDELPQLINVLRGEMSLVGPRPLPLDYLARFTAAEAGRHRVRPGLAGLAQAAGRNAVPWDRRLALDCVYARRPSLWGDLLLLLRCAWLVLRGRGVHAPGHATMPRFREVGDATATPTIATTPTPALPRGAGEGVGGVEEDEARGARRPGGTQRVGGQHLAARFLPAGGDVGAEGGQRRAVLLDEGSGGGAARERLQPERPGAGEGVQHRGILDCRPPCPGGVPQHVEQRLPDAVGGRPGGGAGGGDEAPPAMGAGDDPQAAPPTRPPAPAGGPACAAAPASGPSGRAGRGGPWG